MGEWFISYRKPCNPKASLFCLPFAGGSATLFSNWVDYFPDVEVVGIQLPGRGARIMEPCIDNIDTMVETLVPLIEKRVDLPFFFFGHSMGAVIAFETLVAMNAKIKAHCLRLFVAGRRAPNMISDQKPIHHLDDSDFINELRNLSGTPEEILADKGLMELLIPMLKADFKLGELYLPSSVAVLPMPITAIYGEEDDHDGKPDIAGWENHTKYRLQAVPIRGGHFFINTEICAVIQIIRNNINKDLLTMCV